MNIRSSRPVACVAQGRLVEEEGVDMDEFMIGGRDGYIRITLDEVLGFPHETSFYGGYDVKGKLDIQSGNYYVKGAEVWFTTGQVFQLYVELQEMNRQLLGRASFTNAESDFEFALEMTRLGQITIHGRFKELPSEENVLHFAFESDQSYFDSTLKSLKTIVVHYGDMKGVKEQP